MTDHSLIRTLKNLKGNARACVLTEPLWGIPYNLYSPFISVYMLALGLNDANIGLVASISTATQVFWTAIGGALTDKLGRKRTTFVFDFFAWSIPTLIWAVAQNFTYFLVAAIINSVWRVTQNSWSCLMVEDTEPHLILDIYSWVYIAGLLAAFFAPLTSPLITRFGLVSTMRGLYVLAFVMMTAKFVVLNAMATETEQGKQRMRETAHQGLFDVVRESPAVLKQILRTPATLYTGALLLILNICTTVRGTFWSVLASKELGIGAAYLALYAFARSIAMMLFFFFGMPWLQRQAQFSRMGENLLMVLGFVIFIVSQAILLVVPMGSYGLLLLATVMEGIGTPLTSTMLDKMTVVTVDPKERARIVAWLNVATLLASTPFGWLAGLLSGVNRRLPFVLVVVLFLLGGLVTFLATRHAHRQQPAAA